MQARTRLVALAAAALAITGMLVGTATSVSADPTGGGNDHVTTGGFQPQPINWQPCPERPTDATMSCGTLTLPIDWAHPHGATFQLAVAKQAASDPATRTGSLLINPGGPGGSGVDFALA